MSLEAPTTEMVTYKSSLVSIGILASKSSDADQDQAPRETTEKKISKTGVDFGPESGVDWRGFFGRGKRAEKFGAISGQNRIRDKICASFR